MDRELPHLDRRSWTEKYRPVDLDQITGQIKVLSQLRSWARSWAGGNIPKKRGLIIEGEAGVGKTTAAYALAREMGWEVIELNASDSRNMESIRKMATRGAMSGDITDINGYDGISSPRSKMVLLDEADNLFEKTASIDEGSDVGDRGGKRAIVELIKLTMQPVVLIVNNLYGLTSGSGASLNFTCEKLRFRRLAPPSIAKRLREICGAERIMFEDDVIKAIADRSDGDMRSAIGDLQILCAGKARIRMEDLEVLGFRDNKENIFGVLDKVFNAGSMKASRSALMDVDETIETLMLWMSENIPVVMRHPEELEKAFELLSRSDVYLGRVRRRQNYKLWSYAKDILAALPLAKRHSLQTGSRYNFPSYLRSMSKTKDSRARLKETASALGSLTHTSIRYQKEDALLRLGLLCQRDHEFATYLLASTELSKDHLSILTRDRLKESEMKVIMEGVEVLRSKRATPKDIGGGLSSFVAKNDEVEEVPEEAPKGSETKDNDDEKGPHQSSLFEF